MFRSTIALLLFVAFASSAHAQFGPDGQVGPGESYHIVFATSFDTSLSTTRLVPPLFPEFGGIEAGSWLTTFAAFDGGFLPDWNGVDVVYRAVLSDSTADAIDHTNIQGRVYNTNGELLALDAADFFDGQLETPIGFDEFGNTIDPLNDNFWSGVSTGGGSTGLTCGNWDLTGADTITSAGSTGSTSFLLGDSLQCFNDSARLLGISPAITAPVPEPSSLGAMALSAVIVAVTRRRQR